MLDWRFALSWARIHWWLIAAVVAVFLAIWAWEKITAPFEWLGDTWREWRCVEGSDCYVERLEADNERLRSAVRSAVAEARGQEAVNAVNEQAHREALETRTIIVQAQAEAQGAPDAQTPVGAERDARIRAVRERVCAANPGACEVRPADR